MEFALLFKNLTVCMVNIVCMKSKLTSFSKTNDFFFQV